MTKELRRVQMALAAIPKMAAVYPDGRPAPNGYEGGWNDALDEALLRIDRAALTPEPCDCLIHPPRETEGLAATLLALDYRMVEWWDTEGTSYSLVQVISRSDALAAARAVPPLVVERLDEAMSRVMRSWSPTHRWNMAQQIAAEYAASTPASPETLEGHYPGCSGREGECVCAGRTVKPPASPETPEPKRFARPIGNEQPGSAPLYYETTEPESRT